MSSVNEKLYAAETGYGSIKDEPKTGGGLKLIVIGMLIGAFIGVVGTMALITPYSPLAQLNQEDIYLPCTKTCIGLYFQLPEVLTNCVQDCKGGALRAPPKSGTFVP